MLTQVCYNLPAGWMRNYGDYRQGGEMAGGSCESILQEKHLGVDRSQQLQTLTVGVARQALL